jgi:hypothetical protein
MDKAQESTQAMDAETDKPEVTLSKVASEKEEG